MDRERVTTGTEWELRVGYSRAVRVGDRILVSGTTATDEDGDPVAPGDPAAQARRALEIVVEAIDAAGGAREHVVRTRLYVTDADDWETIGEVEDAQPFVQARFDGS